MNLKDRIQDIFEQYSVYLDKHEDEEKKMDEHKDEKTEMAKKTLANGTTIYTDADAFAVGVDVFIVNEEGERMPLLTENTSTKKEARPSLLTGRLPRW